MQSKVVFRFYWVLSSLVYEITYLLCMSSLKLKPWKLNGWAFITTDTLLKALVLPLPGGCSAESIYAILSIIFNRSRIKFFTLYSMAFKCQNYATNGINRHGRTTPSEDHSYCRYYFVVFLTKLFQEQIIHSAHTHKQIHIKN